jgi:thiamine kinase-like enzyme
LLALPLTLIHGELYASNVLVQYTDTALRVCPIDWEMAAIAPALFDLATLTAGSWCEAERQDLARSYYTALPLDSPWRVAWDAFLTNIDCCRLHLAVQWLGWSPVGAVESEQWQSWLHEALRLAEELRV